MSEGLTETAIRNRFLARLELYEASLQATDSVADAAIVSAAGTIEAQFTAEQAAVSVSTNAGVTRVETLVRDLKAVERERPQRHHREERPRQPQRAEAYLKRRLLGAASFEAARGHRRMRSSGAGLPRGCTVARCGSEG